jgi:hypothetical protein
MTGNADIWQHSGAFVQPSLQWNNCNYYILWLCVCSLRYPAWNAHAPYCHLWPVRLYPICPHYPTNGMIFGKKFLSLKCVFWFSLHILSETFLILGTEREVIKNVYSSSCKGHVVFLFSVNQTRIFFKDFRKKILKYQISWKSVQWEPNCSVRIDGRTDRQTGRNW